MDEDESPQDAFEKRGLLEKVPITDEGPRDGTHLLRFIFPLSAEQSCLQCHDAALGEHLGAIAMKIDTSLVQEKIRSSNSRMLGIFLAEAFLLLG